MIGVVIGTRPEAIKLKPVIAELRKRKLPYIVIGTMQHDSMVLNDEYDLGMGVCLGSNESLNGNLSRNTGEITGFLGDVFTRMELSSVIVQGDTVSALSGAIAANLLNIPVVHVEAGLRTNNLNCPFPEEGIRQMISRIASIHCAPTQKAVDNLYREKVLGKIIFTGNTVVDALYKAKRGGLYWPKDWADTKTKIVVTCHRRENWGDKARILADVLSKMSDVHIVLHQNPKAKRYFLSLWENNHLYDSVPHKEMLGAIANADVVITDSGGVVEEAAILGTRTIIYRECTERPEAIYSDVARLVFNAREIPKVIEELKSEGRKRGTDLFGYGNASKLIVDAIIDNRLVK